MQSRSGLKMRARRTELRSRLQRLRLRTRARLQSHPVYQRKRRRRRLRLLALLALVWLLLRHCNSPETSPSPPAESLTPPPPQSPPQPVVLVRETPIRPLTPRSRVRTRLHPRPKYRAPPPHPEPWLSELRLQVAARSPLLARCFEGAERSGALHWTARIDLQHGVVSDHELSPTLAGAMLTDSMKACVQQVLSTPRYQFNDPGETGMVPRVSMVLEF